MADLEGAAAAVAFASGTAASSSVLLGLLNPGDELVFLGPLYGGTEGLLRSLGERWGITVVDATTRCLQACLTPATRMVCSLLCSCTMCTARSRISGENFGDFLILAPFSSEGASAKPGAVHG